MTSRRYAADLNEIKRLGGDGVTTPSARTPEQTQIALFWVESSPLQWNRIARTVAVAAGLDPWEKARLLGLLNMASSTATSGRSRPSTTTCSGDRSPRSALADTDGNPADRGRSDVDAAAWRRRRSRTTTPATQSRAGRPPRSCGAFFGTDHARFATCSTTLPGQQLRRRDAVSRHYRSFSRPPQENGISRILVGYHFREAVEVGIFHGARVGRWVVERSLQPVRHHHGGGPHHGHG